MVTVSKRLVLVSLYLGHVEVSLLQELADDEDVRGGSISCDVILRRGNLCDERGCRVLNLLRTTRKKKDFATLHLRSRISPIIHIQQTEASNCSFALFKHNQRLSI